MFLKDGAILFLAGSYTSTGAKLQRMPAEKELARQVIIVIVSHMEVTESKLDKFRRMHQPRRGGGVVLRHVQLGGMCKEGDLWLGLNGGWWGWRWR